MGKTPDNNMQAGSTLLVQGRSGQATGGIRIEVAPPEGVDARQARELCVRALAAAMESARGGSGR